MQTQSARNAKYIFGRLIDVARIEPVLVQKYGRNVVIVPSVEEHQHLCAGKRSAVSREDRNDQTGGKND